MGLGLQRFHQFATATLFQHIQNIRQDSRCPADVTCLWPGQAEIIVMINQPRQPAKTLSLIQRPGDEAASTQPVDGMTLRLVDLAPYPTTAQSPAENYTATLMLTRP
ncbi:hypothetical protein [Thermoleptolyngbya sp.]